MIPLKTYSGEHVGMKYAFVFHHVDLDPRGSGKQAIALLGHQHFLGFLARLATGKADCTTCASMLRGDPKHPQRPRTLVLYAHPVQPVILCACHECTERYGGCEEATRMCGEYLVQFSTDPDASVSTAAITELREIPKRP